MPPLAISAPSPLPSPLASTPQAPLLVSAPFPPSPPSAPLLPAHSPAPACSPSPPDPPSPAPGQASGVPQGRDTLHPLMPEEVARIKLVCGILDRPAAPQQPPGSNSLVLACPTLGLRGGFLSWPCVPGDFAGSYFVFLWLETRFFAFFRGMSAA